MASKRRGFSAEGDFSIFIFKFAGSGKALTWKLAVDRCKNSGKRLCLRKDLCNSKTLTPRRTITTPRRDMWVPVLDEYNDWMYIGPKQKRRCKKLSEIDGPASWGGKDCSDNNIRTKNKKIDLFCSISKGYFCCQEDESLQEPAARPVSVYIQSRMEKGIPHYSFSLRHYPNENDWQSDKAPWREGGRIDGDLTKLSLLSGRVKNVFDDPIFFCIRTITTSFRLYTKLHKVSKTWCSYPWRTNFYLYGSYSEPTAVNYQKYLIGTEGTGPDTHTRISVRSSERFSVKFSIYGPTDPDTPTKYYSSAPLIRNNACGNGIEVLDATSGVINSPNYPSSYNSDSSRIRVCNWKIKGTTGSVVRISFKTMKLAGGSRGPFPKLQFRSFQGSRVSRYDFDKICPVDGVKIPKYGTFCGSILPPTFTTIDNEVDISFYGRRGSNGISFALYYEVISPPNGLVVSRIAKEEFDSFTWMSAKKMCEDEGKALCSAKDICSFDSRPFYGVKQGDQWAPISDEYNDWIQIGRGNVHTCRRHNNVHGPPQWGILEGNCQRVNISLPCPKRQFLYCCDSATSKQQETSTMITVSIYSTVQNGVVFFKYLQKGIDNPKQFDGSNIWSPNRKARGDFVSFKLHRKYAPGFDKVVYFCSQELVPGIGRLKKVFAMFLQPCEIKGWKFLFHLYAMNERQEGALRLNVGVYEKRPYHTRIHFRRFPEGFENDQSYVLFAFGTNKPPTEEDVVDLAGDMACEGSTSIITAPSVLESPGYPLAYGNNAKCRWQIRLPDSSFGKDHRLQITIEDLGLEDPVDILSIYEVALTVDFSKSSTDESNRKIFKNRKDFTGMIGQVSFETVDSFLMVFQTDDSVADKGFKIKAEIINRECGGDVRKHGDVITSPNYPMPYPKSSNCKWTIRAPSVHYNIELEVLNFDLLADENCSNSVRIIGVNSMIRLFCGGSIPPKRILLQDNAINVTFKASTESKKGGKGFAFKVLLRPTKNKEADTHKMPQCGVQSVPFAKASAASDRIIGGSVAENGNFPWLVMIGRPGVTCGGTLISDKWVLTATHCFVTQFIASFGIMLLHAPLRQYIIITGRYQRNIPSPDEQIFNVTELAVHGGFQRYSARWTHRSGVRVLGVFPYNDIAMAKLSRKANFSPTVSPACLPTQDAHVGEFCYVAGWGSFTADEVNMVSALNYAKVPILDNSLCNSWEELKGTIMKNAFCAGFPQGGTDHCWGDSGGSLMCRGRYGNFYINGIVSWSRECAGKRTPGVYTRVWSFIDWINKVVEEV